MIFTTENDGQSGHLCLRCVLHETINDNKSMAMIPKNVRFDLVITIFFTNLIIFSEMEEDGGRFFLGGMQEV